MLPHKLKVMRIILIISGTTYTPEDSNPRHDNAVYLHEILPRKRSKKVSEIFSGSLRASTQCIGHSCVFREMPGPLGGLTDGGLAKTPDNHHSMQRKKEKKTTTSDVIGNEGEEWNVFTGGGVRQPVRSKTPPHPFGHVWSAWKNKILFSSHGPGCCDPWRLNPLVHRA